MFCSREKDAMQWPFLPLEISLQKKKLVETPQPCLALTAKCKPIIRTSQEQENARKKHKNTLQIAKTGGRLKLGVQRLYSTIYFPIN